MYLCLYRYISIFYLNLNLIGIAGWHSIYAEKQGLIGISMTNTSPILCPTRSKKAALGTNPISVAAPAKDGDSLVLGSIAQCIRIFAQTNN